MDIEEFQDFPGGVQEGRRIVIARDYHHLAVGSGSRPAEKPVVQFLGPVAGGGAVEDIAGNEEGIDILLFNETGQPVQERLAFFVSFPAVEGAAKMPVGGVDNFHRRPIVDKFAKFCFPSSCHSCAGGNRENA